ncbi:glycosyltransferase family 2 protein [Ferruginibacter sp. HRS2-29]|uniref:glycosyltransferase family 2 protein n=1 Tax=Ferruginibacter sp. HRS2-29 TaxID=2487334 RepID=UPI0020CEDED3|nr:glycosyltransferase family 2 protein [Ferruginibacter sp. HRS2-29]MCP9749561.1 glycosyltransferase family 2 protein [Ferruginibacter sp. HRS2-29]
MQLSIIIVNYNVKYFLEQCLYSVIKACCNLEAEIFVVDNYSTDGSEQYLPAKFPQVKFRWNSHNMGFGKANNSVLSEAKGDHILFLNPDTIVPEDCFEKCLQFFRQHQDCGALGVRMIDGSGTFLKESKRSFPSAMASFYKIIGLAKLFPRSKTFAAYYAGHLPEHKTAPVDVLAGAFMMLDKKMADATQGFDEKFFMYAEDIDLSFRVQKEGKKNYYFADTTIIHFKGESTQKLSKEYINQFYGAMKGFVAKHYKQQWFTYFITTLAISLNKSLASLLLLLKKMLPEKSPAEKKINTAIIAPQILFDEMIHLLRNAKMPPVIIGRIAVSGDDIKYSIGTTGTLAGDMKKNKIEQLVFCEAVMNNKDAIEMIEKLPSKTIFLFHAAGSSSIVGSNEKNRNGIFIAERPAVDPLQKW